jgi:serine/threonine-protein kinase RsbW
MELTFTLCLPREETSVPLVRHLLRATLERLEVEEACIDDMVLALSEACTNVLRHAAPSIEEQYEVEVAIDGGSCRIAVSDTGGGFDSARWGREPPPLDAEAGRGIHLMRVLVDELHFSSEARGTAVEFTKTLSLQPSSLLLRSR